VPPHPSPLPSGEREWVSEKTKGNVNLLRVDIASFANTAGVRITPHALTPIPPDGEDRSED